MTMLFWVVTPCSLVCRYHRFGGTYCIPLQPWRWRYYVSSERWNLPTSLHESTVFILNPEAEDSMFLRKLGIYLRVYTSLHESTVFILNHEAEKLVSIYESTRHDNPEQQHRKALWVLLPVQCMLETFRPRCFVWKVGCSKHKIRLTDNY
jgi:hypothetical protein